MGIADAEVGGARAATPLLASAAKKALVTRATAPDAKHNAGTLPGMQAARRHGCSMLGYRMPTRQDITGRLQRPSSNVDRRLNNQRLDSSLYESAVLYR